MRTIDADALINRLVFHVNLPSDIKEIVEDVINEMPTIQPEHRWIPVTDHLPDEDVPVLVTDDAGGMATVGIDSCGRYEDTGERFWYTSQNVTAWMYTVEPYVGK